MAQTTNKISISNLIQKGTNSSNRRRGGEAGNSGKGGRSWWKGSCSCCTAPAMVAMAASVASCAHCGKQGVGCKRCSRCKQASYCGVECQNADWKRHKKTCAPPVPLQDVAAKLDAADAAGDWRGVVKWEGRMEELVSQRLEARQSDDACLTVLSRFSNAHLSGFYETGSKDHARSYAGLVERRIPLHGKLQRFRDQGEAMCNLSDILRFLDRYSEAATWYQRARDVGAAHGLFSLESKACMGLGRAAIDAGRHEEGVELLRNALVAAELNELDHPKFELDALKSLVYALFKTNSIDEVEPLVLRYRDAAKAKSEKEGVCFEEFHSFVYSARLHEVLCMPPTFGNPLPQLSNCFQHGHTASDCHRLHRAQEKTHAPVEPCALCRHAESLKRQRGRCALCST